LLDELEMEADEDDADDLTKLKHVKPRAEARAAGEIGERTKCNDFEVFEPPKLSGKI
jgi:hypothetical protein